MEINRTEFQENVKSILSENQINKIIVSNPIDKNQKYKKNRIRKQDKPLYGKFLYR